MIQGVHASSVVFSDFSTVSAGLRTTLNSRLPGIDAAGHSVRLQGADFRLRLGSPRKEKGHVVAHLHLEPEHVRFQSLLVGTLRLREAPTRSRTKVTIEGTCSRNFGGLSPAPSTEAVRHVANDLCRSLLDLLVTTIESGPLVARAPGDASVLSPKLRHQVGNRTKPSTKGHIA